MTAISFKCWTPAVSLKKTDNIISSDYSTLKTFTPSYEKESHVCMNQLMANEYQRIWLIERDEWIEKTFVLKNGKTYIRRNSKIIQKGKDSDKSNGKTAMESLKKSNNDKRSRKKDEKD